MRPVRRPKTIEIIARVWRTDGRDRIVYARFGHLVEALERDPEAAVAQVALDRHGFGTLTLRRVILPSGSTWHPAVHWTRDHAGGWRRPASTIPPGGLPLPAGWRLENGEIRR